MHEQDCCESVTIESVTGNLDDLIGSPIVEATENVLDGWPTDVEKPQYEESSTWTVFTFATTNGRVVVRWWGSSNGYYSESVCTVELT